MYLNKQQQQQQHQEQIQTTNNVTSLQVNERNSYKIKPNNTLETDKFTSSGDSCTSSTDSGVNISDTEATVGETREVTTSSSPAKPLRVQFHKNSHNNTNVDKIVDNSTIDEREENELQRAKITRIFENKFKSEQPLRNHHNTSNASNYSNQNPNRIKNEMNDCDEVAVINTATDCNRFNEPVRSASSPTPSSIVYSSDSSDDELPSRQHHFQHRSPAVSIRSIDSCVIDSDSDSDLNGAVEGVHKNYVIKKLGTQVSYPANHPDIPKINDGLQVVNHQIAANAGEANGNPLTILTQIGDSLSNSNPRNAIGQMASVANVPQIAVSASKDITIGDKHFYEGPVTIQQFLIDNRDKRKGVNGKDNPTFQDGSGGDTSNNAKDINLTSQAELPEKSFAKLLRNKKYIIPGVLVFAALVILAIVLGIEAANDSKSKKVIGNSEESRKNVPINSTIDPDLSNPNIDGDLKCVEGKLCLVERDMWRAEAQKNKLDPQRLPLHRVIIAHTASEACNSFSRCSDRVRVIQQFHMNSFGWDDIGYNFLIGSEGRVYAGRGWDDVGAHTKGYNVDSVGIAFIGTYTTAKPTDAQLKACRLLIEEGVRLKKLTPTYKLYGARQLGATESPGDALYKIIRTWDHWSPNV